MYAWDDQIVASNLNGEVFFFHGGDGGDLRQSLEFERRVFALQKADVTGDGTQEVIACSWDAMIYIFSKDGSVVAFEGGPPLMSFSADLLSIRGCNGKPQLCFSGVGFSGLIEVYLLGELGVSNSTASTNRTSIEELEMRTGSRHTFAAERDRGQDRPLSSLRLQAIDEVLRIPDEIINSEFIYNSLYCSRASRDAVKREIKRLQRKLELELEQEGDETKP